MSDDAEHEFLLAELVAGNDDPAARVEVRLTRLTGAFYEFLGRRQAHLHDVDPVAANALGQLRTAVVSSLEQGDYRRAEFDEQNPRNAPELLLALWQQVERGELDLDTAVQVGRMRRQADPRFAVFHDWYDLADNLRRKTDLAPFAGLTKLMAGVVAPEHARLLWLPVLAVNAGA